MKALKLKTLLLVGLPILALLLSCSKVEKPKRPVDISVLQERAKVSVNNWVRKHPTEFRKYKPIAFEDFTARYERTELTYDLYDKLETEKAKPTINKHKVDSLEKLLEKNKGILLGYTILHKYQTKNIAGEAIKHQDLVFLDTNFHVASILAPDAYDMILDQKVIFRLDSTEQK